MKLICLPYAGGASYAFRPWNQYISSQIELVPIEYAGRGRRFGEPLWKNMDEAVNDVFLQAQSLIDCDEYAIFGHSMGSVVAFEVAHLLSDYGKKPCHIIFSGRTPVNLATEIIRFHKLNHDEFLNELVKLGGIPKELIENKEAMDIFLPVIRADFYILENYLYKKRPKKLCCDISVFYSEKDTRVGSARIGEWADVTEGAMNLYKFEGDHFFIFQNADEVVGTINNVLTKKTP